MSKIDVSQINGIIDGGIGSDSGGIPDLHEESGISSEEHKTLRQLIHFIDEGPGEGFTSGAYKEIIPFGSPFPTSITWYENITKTKKIVEQQIVRNSKKIPISIVWRVYNIDGISVSHTVSDIISYVNNIFETSRVRTII